VETSLSLIDKITSFGAGFVINGGNISGSLSGITSSGVGGDLLFISNGNEGARLESSGDFKIVNGGRFDAGDGSQRARMHWSHQSTAGAYRYYHMKTDIGWGTSVQMYSVQFTGHAYNNGTAINQRLVWYNYSPSNAPINIGTSGNHTATLYESSDNKIVMRLDLGAGNAYYSAFTISSFATRQGCVNFSITGTIHSNNTDDYA